MKSHLVNRRIVLVGRIALSSKLWFREGDLQSASSRLAGTIVLLAASALLGILFASATASGFSAPHMFREHLLHSEIEDPGTNDPGGGGDRWFTGSPQDRYTCSVCHRGGGDFPIEIAGLPNDGFTPGKTYNLEITWPRQVVRAAIIGEFVSADGTALGEITEVSTRFTGEDIPSATIESSRDQSRQLFSLTADFLSQQVQQGLNVRWTAPEKAEALWFYMVGVHPDADESGVLDTTEDATYSVAIDLSPSSVDSQASAQGSNCSIVDSQSRPVFVGFWLLLALGGRLRCKKATKTINTNTTLHG